MLNRLILLIYCASSCLKRIEIRFLADSLHSNVCCACHQLSPYPLWFSLLCWKWVWPSWSLSTVEWKSTAIVTAILLSQQILPPIRHVAGDIFVFQQDNAASRRARTPLYCYSKIRWTSLVLKGGHQAAQVCVQWIIRSGVLCARECMNVVWTVSMSWSRASLKSGTVCSRTLLTRHQRVEKRTESVHACRRTTFWTRIVSAYDWQKLWTNKMQVTLFTLRNAPLLLSLWFSAS